MQVPVTWLQAALTYSTWAMILTGGITVVSTLLITAPYGKFSKDKGWGPLVPSKMAWMFMESPNLWMSVVMLLFALKGDILAAAADGHKMSWKELPISNLPNQFLLVAFFAHYFNRSVIFPLFLTQGNPMPASVMLLAFFYCTWNGFTQSLSLVLVTQYPKEWLTSPQYLLGMAIFLLGFAFNVYADHVLIGLKAEAKKKGVNYVIPKGSLFEYVSAANYCKSCLVCNLFVKCFLMDICTIVGEVMEWVGFAIACNSLPAAAFAWYTFSNLMPRALAVSNTFLILSLELSRLPMFYLLRIIATCLVQGKV